MAIRSLFLATIFTFFCIHLNAAEDGTALTKLSSSVELQKTSETADGGLTQDIREKVVELLKKLLANEYVLQIKTQNFHWNVTGKQFGQLHALFESQYNQIAGFVDLVAERIRALGFFSPGSIAEFKENATLQEDAGKKLLDIQMIQNLLEGQQLIIRELRSDIEQARSLNDAGTENFLADILVKHEKMAWMLSAHLDS